MKKFVIGLLVALFAVTGLAAEEANHVRVFSMDNPDKKVTAATIQKAFEKEGFMIEANNYMLGPFKRDFKGVVIHDVYNLMVLCEKDTFRKLAVKYPKIALFTPLSMSIYTVKGGKSINVSSLSPEGIAEMTGIPATDPTLVALGQKIEKALKAAMPKGKFIKLPYKMIKPEGKLIAEATFKIEGDWEDAKDDLEMAFEGELAPNGFVSPAFVDLNYDLDEHDIDAFKFFDAYAICKIPVIYTVSQKHPEAGALAPCTMYLYTKKDENIIHMAFPTVYKWFAALYIKDKESRDVLLDAQDKFEKILEKITKK
jgi:uncharacterized protein (DUF302 family)